MNTYNIKRIILFYCLSCLFFIEKVWDIYLVEAINNRRCCSCMFLNIYQSIHTWFYYFSTKITASDICVNCVLSFNSETCYSIRKRFRTHLYGTYLATLNVYALFSKIIQLYRNTAECFDNFFCENGKHIPFFVTPKATTSAYILTIMKVLKIL